MGLGGAPELSYHIEEAYSDSVDQSWDVKSICVPVLGGVKHSELPEEELAAGVKRRENHLGPKAGSGEVELMEILTPLTSAYHFIANDYCKNDILNNELFWLLCLLCQCQIPLESMRRFAAGVLVAFLKSTVKENGETF
ncbi:hypothetical protein SUGI_0338390 [Cryptomeria japonica]|nr:hypothetical protein SUGI_0338390 [Cryptomeria japonica]